MDRTWQGDGRARRDAEALWTKKKLRDAAAVKDKGRQADALKTARLRELRLAKEAADKETAANAAAAKRATSSRRKTAKKT